MDAFVTLLLEREINLVLEVDKGVQDVQAKLRLWNSILKDLDARKNKSKHIKNLERHIKDLVYRLEDVLDFFLIKVQSGRVRGMSIDPMSLIYQLAVRRKFSLKVEYINTIISKTVAALENSQMTERNIVEEERAEAANQNCAWLANYILVFKRVIGSLVTTDFEGLKFFLAPRETAGLRHFHTEVFVEPQSPVESIVGIENDTRVLRTQIVDEVHRVIILYGITGTGKTSLALKLYHDQEQVRNHFEHFAWINIKQTISRADVFLNMLLQLSAQMVRGNILQISDEKLTTIQKMSEENLSAELRKIQLSKKCLVVLDDLWSRDAWEFLRSALPLDGSKTKILITTAAAEVAEYVAGDDRHGSIHSMKPLYISDSHRLFWQQAFSGRDHEGIDQYEAIGTKIVEQCRGLPIYIIAVGDFLATKLTVQEWEKVLQDSEASVPSLPIIASSYNSLPYHLKPCFLCFGMFPRGLETQVEHLYLLWMAEGIILRDDNEINGSVMDVAERYLTELVQRKLVSVTKDDDQLLTRYRSCSLNSLIHELCLLKGKEDFFEVLDLSQEAQLTRDLCPNRARRTVLYFRDQDNRQHVQLINKLPKYIRSLLLMNPDDCPFKWPEGKVKLRKFRMLRVLNFERMDFSERKLPRDTTQLVHLRYLSFRGCIVKELPSSMSNLSFLLILDLRVESSSQIIIPNVLCKLLRLTHLYLPVKFRTASNEKLQLGKLVELEVLVNFDATVSNAEDLSEMKNLLHLSAMVEDNLKDLECIVQRMKMNSGHASLLHLCIEVKSFHCYTEERHSLFRQLLNCKGLHKLHMDGYLGYVPWIDCEAASSLSQIVLKGSNLSEDPMPIFGMLKKLQVLVLQENAYVGKAMKCCACAFRELRRLELVSLDVLETWKVDNESMPKLSILTIRNCRKLPQVPDGLISRVPSVTFENNQSGS